MVILIVEDEAEITELIRLYLEREGFTCHACRDGESALRYQQSLQPDLIILDLMLPQLDGLEVCSRIRQRPGDKDPFILCLQLVEKKLIGLWDSLRGLMITSLSRLVHGNSLLGCERCYGAACA